MKKFTGRYTTNTAKALKGSERILCQVSEDGTIYIKEIEAAGGKWSGKKNAYYFRVA